MVPEMRRLSTTTTWWYKKAFPALWFGFLGVATLAGIWAVIRQNVPAFPLVIPVVMAVFGYVLMKLLVFPLADEVWPDGDEVIVRNRGQEARIPLDNVVNVQGSMLMNPEHIVLTLRQPCCFGREIVFAPALRMFPWGRNPLADELIRRIHGLDEEVTDE